MYTFVYSMLAPPLGPKGLGPSTSSTDLVGVPTAETAHGIDEADSETEETAVSIPLVSPEALPATPPQVRY